MAKQMRPNNRPAPKAQPRPVQRKRTEQAEAAPGDVLWRLALLLCTGLTVIALLFASVNGGSVYTGATDTDKSTKTTPTPPVETMDPSLNITGSDQTPIPPSPSPETPAQ